MDVTMMQTISIAAFVLAGIFSIAAVVLWLRLDIREVLADLSGKKVKYQVQKQFDDSTAVLQEEYRLILNEIVIHTKERI